MERSTPILTEFSSCGEIRVLFVISAVPFRYVSHPADFLHRR